VFPLVADTVIAQLPNNTWHGWRYIVAYDDKLYVTIGAPCNIPGAQHEDCLSRDKEFGSIIRMNLDGTAREIYATGIRNSVGVAFHPSTKQMWFTVQMTRHFVANRVVAILRENWFNRTMDVIRCHLMQRIHLVMSSMLLHDPILFNILVILIVMVHQQLTLSLIHGDHVQVVI
jgi:hypothetical protein